MRDEDIEMDITFRTHCSKCGMVWAITSRTLECAADVFRFHVQQMRGNGFLRSVKHGSANGHQFFEIRTYDPHLHLENIPATLSPCSTNARAGD